MNDLNSKTTSLYTEANWSRERKRFFQWIPSISLITSIRSYQHHKTKKGILSLFSLKAASIRWRVWSIITASDIGRNVQISGGILLPHPTGIVIHDDVVIGANCMIMQQVTIGMIEGDKVATIGGNVYIGAGAKILGPVQIGDNARIGANAVVLNDIPRNCTAVGIPARIIVR